MWHFYRTIKSITKTAPILGEKSISDKPTQSATHDTEVVNMGHHGANIEKRFSLSFWDKLLHRVSFEDVERDI